MENISLPQAAVTANIPAGAGIPAGWLGLPALPFPGCDPAAIPEGSRPGAQRLFMLRAPAVVFPSRRRGAGVAPREYPGEPWPLRVPSAHREKGRIVKKKKKPTSDPEQGSQSCGCKSTEPLLFPAFLGAGIEPPPAPSRARCVPRDFRSRGNGGTWHTRGFVPPGAIPVLRKQSRGAGHPGISVRF